MANNQFNKVNNAKPETKQTDVKDIDINQETIADVITKPDEPQEKGRDNKATESSPVAVIYIGNGVWCDCEGVLWHRESGLMRALGSKDVKTINKKVFKSQQELDMRKDITFMIGYGEMRQIDIE